MNMTQPIHIFYACDDNFVKYTLVSITSLMEHADPERYYHIHVLYTDIADATRGILQKLQNDHYTITFDYMGLYLESVKEDMPLRDYYSKTTYYRLFIAEMFPMLNKALYIDSDTIVTGNIAALYDEDLDGYALAACHEQVMIQTDIYGTYVETCLGIDRHQYFNAGVLLLNCDYFRKKNVLAEFMHLLGFYHFSVTQDEDYLNVICQDKVKWLPQIWNTEVYGEISDTPEQIAVYHYIMTSKPWHYTDCRFGEVFWHYAAKTEVYAEIQTVLQQYTDAQRERDAQSCQRLAELASSEIARPDHYMARIRAKENEGKDPGRVKVLEKIDLLERQGLFDRDVEDDPPSRAIQPGEVDYLGKRWSSRFKARLAFSIAHGFVRRLKRKNEMIIKEIHGAQYLSSLTSGAIMTCNHFHAFDSFAVQLAYESAHVERKRKFYRIIKEGNYTSFPGFYGYLMRNCRTLPLSSHPKTMQELIRAVDQLLAEGHIILIYPEQSMWWNYRKPKPLKQGGFHFAAKNGVPIVPCFITMQDSNIIGKDGFPVQEYTIHISEPIYPDPAKRVSQNTEEMMQKNYDVWKQIYEQTYGKPLVYLTEKS